MNASADLRLLNTHTLQILGDHARRKPNAAIVAVVVEPLPDRQIETTLTDQAADERDLVAAAIACLTTARGRLLAHDREPDTDWADRIAGALDALAGGLTLAPGAAP